MPYLFFLHVGVKNLMHFPLVSFQGLDTLIQEGNVQSLPVNYTHNS